MDSERALKIILERVYLPQFVKTCQRHGLEFQDADELEAALKIAGLLRLAGAKPSTSESSPISKAADALETLLADSFDPEELLKDKETKEALQALLRAE